jgi:hypothetical protein
MTTTKTRTTGHTPSTTQHTPGPWTCHSGMVWKDGPNVYPKGNEDGIPIASMCREPNNGTEPVERDANAKLIAAAPELLDAVKQWEIFLFTAPGDGRTLKAVQELIAKAEGRTP